MMVLSHPVWCERFVEELTKARAAFSPDDLGATVDAWAAQIATSVAEDTRRPFSAADHEAAVQSMKDFFGERAAFVDAWLAEGGHCPAVF